VGRTGDSSSINASPLCEDGPAPGVRQDQHGAPQVLDGAALTQGRASSGSSPRPVLRRPKVETETFIAAGATPVAAMEHALCAELKAAGYRC